VSDPRPVAIVTGGARRVGRAIALELSRSGFDLILTCNTSREEAQQTLRDSGVQGIVLQADLSDPAQVNRLAGELSALPRADAIIHNASSYSRSSLGSISDEEVISHLRINALAPLLLTQAVAGQLSRSTLSGGGAVVCLSDLQALGRPQRGYTAYAMSKAALNQLVQSLAVELAPKVRVNGIAPGVIAWPEGTPRDEIAAYETKIPLGRSGTPHDAAACVRWLVIEATYITGEIIRLDGGRWLR
jgi:pteridine reductase